MKLSVISLLILLASYLATTSFGFTPSPHSPTKLLPLKVSALDHDGHHHEDHDAMSSLDLRNEDPIWMSNSDYFASSCSRINDIAPLCLPDSPGIEQYHAHRFRQTRVGQLVKAGTKSITRYAHSVLGLGSLVMGGAQFTCCTIFDMTMPMSERSLVSLGALHILTAFLGLHRLDFDPKSKDWNRNTLLFPVPLQNLWMIVTASTEWVKGDEAWISMMHPSYMALTASILAVSAWQLSCSYVSGGDTEQEKQRSGIWFKSPFSSALVTLVTYSGPLLVLVAEALYIALTKDPMKVSSFTTSHPEYSNILTNIMLGTVFLNNFVVFEATLVKYKVATTQQVAVASIAASLTSTTSILYSFSHADGGTNWADLLNFLTN